MKVMYFIFKNSTGRKEGGHYYSLASTAKGLSEINQNYLVSIGCDKSYVLEETGMDYSPIIVEDLSIKNIVKVIANIKQIIDFEKPDVLHSFDFSASFFAHILSLISGIPHIHTKCGGSNPPYFWPSYKYFIVYSKENYDYFKNTLRFKFLLRNTIMYLIPNRINAVPQDYSRICELRRKINSKLKTFIIVARITEIKYEAIMQSIRLVNDLNGVCFEYQLIIIGNIQSDRIYQKLMGVIVNYNNNYPKQIIIITDEKFTSSASELLEIADYIIATGRSFMEAAHLNKILFSPIIGQNYPLLVKENNINVLFKNNFSGRLDENDRNLIMNNGSESIKKISSLLNDDDYINRQKLFISEYSKNHFNLSSVTKKYSDIYNSVEKSYRLRFLNIIIVWNIIRKMK